MKNKINKHFSKSTFIGLFVAVVLSFNLSSCGLNKQANSMKALKQCKFEIVGVDSLLLGGANILPMIEKGELDVALLPGVALSFISGQLPLMTKLQMRVENPSRHTAGIQQFSYQVLMDGKGVMEGTSDLPFAVKAGTTEVVPIKIQSNVYELLNDKESREKIMALISEVRQSDDQQSNANHAPTSIQMTLKIKPTIGLGNTKFDYPGHITLNKSVNRNTIKSLQKRLQ